MIEIEYLDLMSLNIIKVFDWMITKIQSINIAFVSFGEKYEI